jgi:hypothetical protein
LATSVSFTTASQSLQNAQNSTSQLCETPWFQSDQPFNQGGLKALSLLFTRYLRTQGILGSTIYTNCDGVETYTDASFAVFNNIDVDNNPETGEDGNDISVQYLLLPWIELEPYTALGLMLTISVERLGNELKDKEFSIRMKIGNNDLGIGYTTPSTPGNEIPRLTRASLILLFNPFQRTYGIKLVSNPQFETGLEGKIIDLIAEYNDNNIQRKFSLEFDPAVQTEVSLWSTNKLGEWQYQFLRQSTSNARLTARFSTIDQGEEKETMIMIDKLPEDLSFTLELTPFSEGGGQFSYTSSESYDIELLIHSDNIGSCGYATMKNTPREIHAEWIPSLNDGYYALSIDSDGTDFILKDSLEDPIINLTIRNLNTMDFTAHWNLSNPGDFLITRQTDLVVDLEFLIGTWQVKLNAEPVADKLATSWYVDTAGYVTIDTDWKPLSVIDILIKGDELGARFGAESFKAEDCTITWSVLPPILPQKTGDIEWKIFSTSVDIFWLDTWYHLWPPW